ncbi:MAG: DJ-1/PfpI family protein [Bifidobacteriaceae bacterium]|jgi:4-methyl-5(b-hydroxyethyl)-thiazole monophosphate biosynthesis|nr:DJ-1/PfpI family protein [Bifidobacteriaceae bacterium]
MSKKSKKIGIMVTNGSEDIELFTPIDILKRAGAEIELYAVCENISHSQPIVITRSGTKVICDKSLYDKSQSKIIKHLEKLDCVVIPGGQILEGFGFNKEINKLPKPLTNLRKVLLSKIHDKDFLLASICASTGVVLEKWGIITPEKYKYTGYPGTSKNISGAPYEICMPKNKAALVSANSPSSAITFSLFLASVLYGTNKSDQIANDILFFEKLY